jgi:GNAT superfamily N-acetyltransferase
MWQNCPNHESDEPGQLSFWNELFPGDASRNDSLVVICPKLSVQRDLFFVATNNSKVAGTATAGFDDRGWVYPVAVTPRHRNQGIGRLMMGQVEESLSRIGCLLNSRRLWIAA